MPTILVVDDEPDLCTVMEILLPAEGFEVRTARNGVQAMDIARQPGIDLVFTDLMMPKMDGLQLCRQLRADPATRHIPILMHSAKGLQPEGRGTLYDDFLAKPSTVDEQLQRIRRLLDRRKSRAAAA